MLAPSPRASLSNMYSDRPSGPTSTSPNSASERTRTVAPAVVWGCVDAVVVCWVVAVGVCRAGTDFDAVDDQRVHVFFVICATRDEVHLRLMAKVAWLVRHGDLVARLRTADSREGIVRLLSRKAPAL